MIKNYFKIAFRNIIRHKAFAAINIAGLAIGMTCSIFILFWVQNELSYDRFHKNANEIYRITANAGDFNAAVNCAGMPPELKIKIPAVKNYVRLSHPSTNVFEAVPGNLKRKMFFMQTPLFCRYFHFHW